MSMITKQINELKEAATLYLEDIWLSQILNEAADTISALSAKLHSHNTQQSSNYYEGKNPFLVKVNNKPVAIHERYVVVRLDHTELWYYGQYDNEDFAYRVADEIGNGFVIEVVE